jgi:hypothetical protein
MSEVGSSDHIGFTNSGYDRKYVTFLCQKLAVQIVLDSMSLEKN